MIHGVINVYKEAGMTSFQVVYRLRKLTGEKKIGHTGTLDPDATGILPVCIGKATKLVDFLMDSDKQYKATLLFGQKTDTQDVSGTVLQSMEDTEVRKILQNEEQILQMFERFTGKILQVPPMYSAVKVDGVKLVDAARKGMEIERKERPVTVFGYEDIRIQGLSEAEGPVTVAFTVNCSKGTYIRTLCEDLGDALGVPACLKTLERTRTGGLGLSESHTLTELDAAAEEGRLEELIIPTDRFLMHYPEFVVKDEAIRKLIYGNQLFETDLISVSEKEAKAYRVYDRNGKFYAVYRYDPRDHQYKCEKMFSDPSEQEGSK